ncbi:MAG: YeeE/YedE family protein [Parachlamydiales bacterium]|nr:YeeE/YedE family protein [Parachlamydiales bacterium]
MTIISTSLLGLVLGIIFGITLEKSRVFEPGIILEQLYLKKFIMLKVFLTAIITDLIVFAFFFTFGWDRLSWKTTHFWGDIVGGSLLGLGIAISGACPGTVFAQIGAGYKDALATFFGGITGVATFIFFRQPIRNGLHLDSGEKLTIDTMIDLPFLPTALVIVAVFSLLLVFLEKRQSWRKEIGKNGDGTNNE